MGGLGRGCELPQGFHAVFCAESIDDYHPGVREVKQQGSGGVGMDVGVIAFGAQIALQQLRDVGIAVDYEDFT